MAEKRNKQEHIEKARKGEDGIYFAIERTGLSDIYLHTARRFTEEEKKGYVKEFAEEGMVGTGFYQELKYVTWRELPQRPSDGSFPGCYNRAWIISPQEFDRYRSTNEERERQEQAKKEEARRKREEEEELARKEKEALISRVDSWTIEEKSIQDEGGWTKIYYHSFVVGGEELRFTERNIFDFGIAINPDYPVAAGLELGGLAWRNEAGILVWNDFVPSQGWVEVRPLTENEQICYAIVSKYGKFARSGIRM